MGQSHGIHSFFGDLPRMPAMMASKAASKVFHMKVSLPTF